MNRLLLLLAMALVGSAALFAHRALEEATPLAVAAWRLGFASVFFLLWGVGPRARAGEAAPITPKVTVRLLVAGLCLALHFLTWFASLQHISIARSTLLVCTTPLWTTLGGRMLGRRSVPVSYWPALALALFGVWLLVRTGGEPATAAAVLGDGYAVAGGLFFAVYLLAVEGLSVTLTTRRQVTVTYSVAAVVLWMALLLRSSVQWHYAPAVWGAILGMALGPQIGGHTLLNYSLKHFSSSTVAFATLLEPVIAALLAWLLLHQTLTAGQIVGGLLVLACLGLVIVSKIPSPQADIETAG